MNRNRGTFGILAHLMMAALNPDEIPSGFLQPRENLLPVHRLNDISNKIEVYLASIGIPEISVYIDNVDPMSLLTPVQALFRNSALAHSRAPWPTC